MIWQISQLLRNRTIYLPIGTISQDKTISFVFKITFVDETHLHLSWVPEAFVARGGNFRCWPKADTSPAVGRLAETASGKAARKTSGAERCFSPSPLTFELFYRIIFTPIRLKVSNCDHVGRHVKKCPRPQGSSKVYFFQTDPVF